MCGGHIHSHMRCQWDRPRRPDDNLLTIITTRPGASGAGTWADEHSRCACCTQGELNGDKLHARHVPQEGRPGWVGARGIVTTCRIAGTWNTWGVEEVGELRPDAVVGLGQRLVRKVSSCRALRLIQGSEADARHGKLPLIGLIGPNGPRLSPRWGVDPLAPASAAVGVPVRT